MKIAICTGKTGGHFFPALAVARFLREKDASHEPFFIGTRGGLDEALLRVEDFRFEAISGCGLPRRFHWKTLKCFFALGLALIQTRRIFKRARPDVVLSFGGYISCAPVLTAYGMKIPVVIHEANAHPGRANRFLSRWAKAVCTSFPIEFPVTGYRLTVHVTGLPIREVFLRSDRAKGFEHLNLDPARQVILVMGGSLGSPKINECLVGALHDLGDWAEKVQIIHITGRKDYERVVGQYRPNGVFYRAYPFLDEVEYAFRAADLFIGRAGASTLAEIMCCGLASILIPYPDAVEDHQWANATYLASRGAACVLEESQLSPRVLAGEMIRILGNERLRSSLAQSAKGLGIGEGARRIVDVVEEVLA